MLGSYIDKYMNACIYIYKHIYIYAYLNKYICMLAHLHFPLFVCVAMQLCLLPNA